MEEYEEEDTCHMEEDTSEVEGEHGSWRNMRMRIHVI
jgi:hypothetical protein